MPKTCPYKHALGVPKKGKHEMRIPGTNTAAFDYILTIVGAWLLTRLTKIPIVLTTVLLFILGEVLHYMFCVPSQTLQFFKL